MNLLKNKNANVNLGLIVYTLIIRSSSCIRIKITRYCKLDIDLMGTDQTRIDQTCIEDVRRSESIAAVRYYSGPQLEQLFPNKEIWYRRTDKLIIDRSTIGDTHI